MAQEDTEDKDADGDHDEAPQRPSVGVALGEREEDQDDGQAGQQHADQVRRYLAQDVLDAELAHLLRRGGQPLGTIATVLGELRDAGSLDAPARSLEGWRRDLTFRGLAQLYAAGQLSIYLDSMDGSASTGSASKHGPH
ncbi:hypothetical protein [Streptomyces sp. NPDC060333]|uniref:hypothetical protein n=1 Tax=Streptomyces sp. NPDC060333 TaxID=3347098 RepID=UPI003651C715